MQVSSPNTNVHQTCIEVFCSRAKLVLGDLNAAGIDEVIAEIKKSGRYVIYRSLVFYGLLNTDALDREAVCKECDITSWDRIVRAGDINLWRN